MPRKRCDSHASHGENMKPAGACCSQAWRHLNQCTITRTYTPHATVGRGRLEHIDSRTLTVTAALFSACSETMDYENTPTLPGAGPMACTGVHVPLKHHPSPKCVYSGSNFRVLAGLFIPQCIIGVPLIMVYCFVLPRVL